MSTHSPNRTEARASVLAVAALALAGCVTPPTYGPIGDVPNQYGYRDRQNPDGSHVILVVAGSAPQAQEFWDRRATEICGSADFEKNIFRAQRPIITTTGDAPNALNPAYGASYTPDSYGDFLMEGYLHCPSEAAPAADTAPVEELASAPTP